MPTINLIKPRLSSSVNISIEALVKAVGLRPNCVEVINNKVTYINEYNAFGNGNTLNRNALLVYMYLHFLDVNSEAHCVLDLYQAHKYLDLPERTILNNLRILSRKDYICFCPGTLDGTYDIFINYYTTKALPANAGGKGFIVLSKILLDKLKKLPGINELRFTVRGLMNKVPGKQNMKLSDGCNMSKLKTMFPTYTQVKDSLLRRDSTLSSLISVMKTDMMGSYKASNGKTYSLANLGISTSSKNYNEGGLLHIKGDEDDDEFADSTNTLMKMLEEDPDTVKEVLSGLASNLYDSLNKKMSTSTMSSALTFYNDKEMASQLSDYKKEISNWESKLSDMEEKYYSQFSAMETALAKLQSQQNTLSSYLGS